MALKIPTDKIDKKRQRDALMPNIIHSFDASNVVKAVEILRDKNIEIFTIHDCFASQAANIYTLQHSVKLGFIKLYVTGDVLSRFHDGCLRSLENRDPSRISVQPDLGVVVIEGKSIKIPQVPTVGKLDIPEIINSKYMVS
jgi:DNA-directed RNA polymerase, mitochondrial